MNAGDGPHDIEFDLAEVVVLGDKPLDLVCPIGRFLSAEVAASAMLLIMLRRGHRR